MIAVTDTVEAVSKRVEANRRNAARSTGPKSPEGKAKVRHNALKHGLTAALPLLPGEDPELLESRTEAWSAELKPRSEIEHYLLERVVVASLQWDRCDRALAAKLSEQVQFGPFDRDELEAEAVADDARLLFFDPRGPIALYPHFRGLRYTPRISCTETVDDPLDPAKIVGRLEGTYTGCHWLLERWTDLRRLLEDDLEWQAPDRLKAIRLLGRQPMDALADERVMMIYLACDAMEPGGPTSLDDLLTETTDDELKLFKERVKGRGADRKKPASPEAGRAVLLGLIEKAVAPLAAKMTVHRAHRAFEEARQQDLLAFDDSPEGELMRRYYLAKGREFNRLLSIYFKVRREADAAVDGEWDPETVGPELESRLQAALGMDIPAETGTPTIQPLESSLQAAVGPEIPAETGTPTIQPPDSAVQPDRAIASRDETKPISPDTPLPAAAEPALLPDSPEPTAQPEPSRPLSPAVLGEPERRPMS